MTTQPGPTFFIRLQIDEPTRVFNFFSPHRVGEEKRFYTQIVLPLCVGQFVRVLMRMAIPAFRQKGRKRGHCSVSQSNVPKASKTI